MPPETSLFSDDDRQKPNPS